METIFKGPGSNSNNSGGTMKEREEKILGRDVNHGSNNAGHAGAHLLAHATVRLPVKYETDNQRKQRALARRR